MNPQAVLLLYVNPDNPSELLSVSRKNEHNSFGLPGGKVNEQETLLQALIREVEEEVGISINPLHVEFLYQAIDSGYDTSTYIYNSVPLNLPTLPFINSEGSLVSFEPFGNLVNKDTCQFHQYNLDMFTKSLDDLSMEFNT